MKLEGARSTHRPSWPVSVAAALHRHPAGTRGLQSKRPISDSTLTEGQLHTHTVTHTNECHFRPELRQAFGTKQSALLFVPTDPPCVTKRRKKVGGKKPNII